MALKRPTVLVVDDAPVNLHLAFNILKKDYRVLIANNGLSALEQVTASPPDLILLDVVMPGMNGYDVCRRIKANPLTSHIPVIFLTSKTEVEDEQTGFLVGAADFIHKPFNPSLVCLRVKTHLEIKFLQELLRNESAEERSQRHELMQIFSKYVSDEVAEEMWRERAQFLSGNRPHPQELNATVMFTDIRGFTSISERLGPRMLFEWLNEYMETMTQIVTRHRGMVNKYIGDAMMVIFGAPIPRSTESEIATDAKNAAECALAMRESLQLLNSDFVLRGLPEVRIRVGICSGPLIAGTLGSSSRMEYTVIGDTVNTAARLEQMKGLAGEELQDEVAQILVSEATRQLIGDEFQTWELAPVTLRGKTELVSVHRMEGRTGH